MKKAVLFSLFVIFQLTSLSAQVKVSLVLSDNLAGTGYEAQKRLNESVSGFKKDCEVRVYSLTDFEERDLGFLENSDLIFVYVHQPPVFERARPYLLPAIEKGAKAYALGSTPAEKAYSQSGLIFNLKVLSYYDQGGVENLKNMVLFRLDKDFSRRYTYRDVISYPETGIYGLERDTIFTSLEAFKSAYTPFQQGNPWVGIHFLRYELVNNQHRHIDAYIRQFERAGFNVLPVFGYPLSNSLRSFCMDTEGRPVIDFLVTTSFLRGGKPEEVRKLFQKMGIPVINAIQTGQTRKAWEASKSGISVFERTYSLARPELTGHIQPTVTASEETVRAPDGRKYMEKRAIDEQVERLVGRVKAWNNLRQKPNKQKNISLIYYNYPPGKDNIGASYLNVLPESMFHILSRMQKEGYDLGGIKPDSARLFNEIMDRGRNIGNWAPAEIAALVKQGDPVLVPVDLYKKWFGKLNPAFREKVIEKWGAPEHSRIMTWKEKTGKAYFVLPAVRYGKILLTPQPARGWGQDIDKMYHDVSVPPHHQYIAFYLYMRHSFHADAVIHLGTHGTHEWLNGKEAGLGSGDAPEALIGDLVNIYPYIVDNIGEGLQAKRRGMAVVIDHLTPPFGKAGLNPELHELSGLINEYHAASEKSGALAGAKLTGISELAGKLGLLKDLDLQATRTPDDVHELEHYIKEIAEKQTPLGLHSFGQSPPESYARSTAEAIVDRQQGLSRAERDKQISELTAKLLSSGKSELDALISALNGRYIRAGQGNDPLRNPASLPTGKNFYAFDPSRIPSAETYEAGSRLAEELIENYQKKHNGAFPDKVTFNLWSTETIRHEGIMESQILKLLGVKPAYDAYGRVTGVEIIPRQVLNRPRVDVVMVPSGLYRDVFSNLMQLLDEAVNLAGKQNETDNYIRKHILAVKKTLLEQGVKDEELARRLASIRMFSVPPGTYGTGLEDVVQASGTWKDEKKVAGVYFNRMSYLYGQGFWGEKPEHLGSSGLKSSFSLDLFKRSLSGTKTVVHSRSSNMYGALDNDDFFQYLGGTAMAVRAVDGKTPDVTVTNLSDPAHMGQESLDKFIGREMKTRYLNPKWINEMLGEGYSGARMVNKVVSHLWGWQVTVPEAIDEGKWQQVYETYVEDKYQLNIKEQFRKAKNMYAYQVALSRMLEVVRKGYWEPGEQVTEKLVSEYLETIEETGLSCNGNVCSNPRLAEFVQEQLEQIKGVSTDRREVYSKQLAGLKQVNTREQAIPHPEKQVARHTSDPNFAYQPKTEVKGYKMEEVTRNKSSQAKETDRAVKTGLILLSVLLAAGFFIRKD